MGSLKPLAVVLWLLLTVALASWWLIFGLRQLDHMSALREESAQLLLRHQRMLLLEGATLIALLLGGGLVLLWAIVTEMRRSLSVREFFATFTHEVKTSLASLRLQAESLQEDLKGHASQAVLLRLVKDAVRLQLQLENSLFVAEDGTTRLLFEEIDVRQFITSVCHSWPDLQFEILTKPEAAPAIVSADRRALESVLKNIIQNSLIHGRAKRLNFQITSGRSALAPTNLEMGAGKERDEVAILVSDDGRGFSGDSKKLGEKFFRHAATSGTGVGLAIVHSLMREMHGRVEFPVVEFGFAVRICFPLAQPRAKDGSL